MFITFTNRFLLLQHLPKGGYCCEVGVFKGDYSQKILKIVEPKNLVLIDPWKYSEDTFNPFPDTPDHLQPIYRVTKRFVGTGYSVIDGRVNVNLHDKYEQVKERFKDCDSVKIIKKSSHEAVIDFPDETFYFIYLDGNHQYEWILRNILEWSKKLKPGGIIGLNDVASSPCGRNQNLGVLEAISSFIKRSDLVPIVLTLNDFAECWITNNCSSSYVMDFKTSFLNCTATTCNDHQKGGYQINPDLLKTHPDLPSFVIEVDDSWLHSFNHKNIKINDEKMVFIPSFK